MRNQTLARTVSHNPGAEAAPRPGAEFPPEVGFSRVPIVVRECGPSDLPALLRLAEHVADQDDALRCVIDHDVHTDPGRLLIAAVAGGAVVGAIGFSTDTGSVAHVVWLALDPALPHKPVLVSLLRLAVSHWREVGALKVSFDVRLPDGLEGVMRKLGLQDARPGGRRREGRTVYYLDLYRTPRRP